MCLSYNGKTIIMHA